MHVESRVQSPIEIQEYLNSVIYQSTSQAGLHSCIIHRDSEKQDSNSFGTDSVINLPQTRI